MGDRANLYFRDTKGSGVGIYAHSAGPDGIAEAAVAVLNNANFRKRLGDVGYALRIGIQTALESLGAKSGSEYSFGVWTPSTGMCDNSCGICVIDIHTGFVYVTSKGAHDFPDDDSPPNTEPTVESIEREMRSWDWQGNKVEEVEG